MQCNMHNVTRISGYNQAARYFEETKKPRTVKWGEDERPLYNTRSHHYRIVKGEENGARYYDLVLYATPMIRYYEPNQNNEHRVLVRGHGSSASGNFLWHHGMGRNKSLWCIDGNGQGREGKLLLNQAVHNAEKFGVPYNWSADLMFTDSSLRSIDLTRSRHIPGYKAASSDEDKAKRKQLKQAVDHWIELLGYRLEEYLNTEIDTNKWNIQRVGEAFTSATDLMTWAEQDVLRRALKDTPSCGEEVAMDSEDFVNAMTQLGHAVATHLQGLKENKARGGWKYDINLRQYVKQEDKPLEPVTRADFRKSMESHLISLLNLREGSARVDIGQFPESIPRRWWC